MENFILIIIAIAIGYFFQKIKLFPKDTPTALNQFVIYISLPALILLEIPTLEFSKETMIPMIMAWSIMTISAILTFFASKLFKFTKEVTGALMLVTVLGNTSFLGIPLIEAYYGKEATAYILVYDQLGTFIVLATYATFIVSIYSSTEKLNLKMVGIKVITFPPLISLILALFLMDVTYPKELTNILSIFAATIIPLVLVALGLQLQFTMPKEDIKPFGVSLGIKLIIAPLIALFIAYLMSWDGLSTKVSILEAGMPSMISAGAMASMAGLAPRLSTAIVGYGIIFSFITSGAFYLYLG